MSFCAEIQRHVKFLHAMFVYRASGSVPAVYCGRVINSRSSDDENAEENEACETWSGDGVSEGSHVGTAKTGDIDRQPVDSLWAGGDRQFNIRRAAARQRQRRLHLSAGHTHTHTHGWSSTAITHPVSFHALSISTSRRIRPLSQYSAHSSRTNPD